MLKKLKTIVKNLLANPHIRATYNTFNTVILGAFSSNRLFATIYSWLGFITFNREQYAVLRARRNYYSNLRKQRNTHVELRRNIHRLEKGMTMQPRRPVFARDYIGETVDFYQTAVSGESIVDEQELVWAHDVLERYFATITVNDDVVDMAHEQFQNTAQPSSAESEMAPYASADRPATSVSYDELLELAVQRRSIRWFQDKAVPRELVDKALLVARQSPSACNRLPYEFRIFDEPSLAKDIAAIPFGSGGYSHQIPTIIVVVGKLDSYFSPRDRHAIYIDSSLASMGFMYALETLGLSSSVINWPDFEPLELKMQKKLNLDASERVVMLIAVGYADPAGGVPYSQKKSLNVLRRYNDLGQ